MAFLGRIWPAFGTFFNQVFTSSLSHILFHAFLYSVLALLLVLWIQPFTGSSYLKIMGWILLVGLLHEGIQVMLAGAWPGWAAELFDLAVDLCGGALGLALLVFFRRRALHH